MASQGTEDTSTEFLSEAIAKAIHFSADAAQFTTEAFTAAAVSANALGQTVAQQAFQFAEQGTETAGQFVTPIATHPLVKYAAKVPGINWLTTALGQVDAQKAQKEVDDLRLQYPLETPEQLAHRIIVDTALKAGSIGLIANFVPPLALALFAVDLAAIATLQAEMIYRIAAAYGFSLLDSTRRGEVLAIFGLSVGGSSTLKVGLSWVELLPVIGAVVGASSNAGLIYTLGYIACRFYEAKKRSLSDRI
ncbi:MAG TPA: hypothetical protein DDW76_32655 [Cyanobacteria bacterium UBA11369]|nr:hypothetical protein [Cyanobacteria bacterium UBA11371]HBE30044.1 hypothetical protein [Cyanobacteria bacterium UBA11368]HBE53383.1 hypothetical protein [Cyanobacteria bacterium UBA11369]